MPIRPLPPLLVNQIAAGEVIERPASVVKELIENAIDAGGKRIDITIESGGIELIRVTDDGCGVPLAEAALMIAPHATSKIQSADDLDAIASLGFRGEALASIASVSRMSIVTRPADQQEATIIETEGDQASDPRPASGPIGTSVTVRNLFFNTPARRKFLRTEQTETGRVRETIQNLALAHPTLAFSFTVDGRTVLDLAPNQSSRQRVLDILGEELGEQFLELDSEDRGLSMWAMIGQPEIARSTTKHMRVFLNGRTIVDRSINHAIREAYRGLIEPSRFPTVVLFLQLDPSQVDVNVHPTKAEVRFRNQGAVHGAVLSAVRGCLRQADLTPKFDLSRTQEQSRVALADLRSREFGTGLAEPKFSGPDPSEFVEYFRSLDTRQKGFVYSEVRQSLAAESPELLEEPPAHSNSSASIPTLRNVADVMQIHSTYLVAQDEQGIVIIDQHALHERVMFEKLRDRVQQGNLESQRMLMPAIVPVSSRQQEAVESLRPLLEQLGIEAEALGPGSVAVHAFTSLLFERNVDPVTFMTELLDNAIEKGLTQNPEAALHEVLDMMACKAAIKAGDRLAPEELAELMKYRERIERSSNCPHGRPTSLRLSIRDLEKQFGRT